jgi:hypothetical protein
LKVSLTIYSRKDAHLIVPIQGIVFYQANECIGQPQQPRVSERRFAKGTEKWGFGDIIAAAVDLSNTINIHDDTSPRLQISNMAFKVLIAGGSISGLTLALIFERYGIDYLLLEKHTEIAPFLGTTVGINPNGARILDQLGVYSELDKIGAKHNTNYYYDWRGRLLAAQKPIEPLMTWLLVKRRIYRLLSTPSRKCVLT